MIRTAPAQGHEVARVRALEIPGQGISPAPEQHQDVEVTGFKRKGRLKTEMEGLYQYKST